MPAITASSLSFNAHYKAPQSKSSWVRLFDHGMHRHSQYSSKQVHTIQNHLMWIDYLGENLIINTEKGRQKTYNIRSDNNISLVIFEPQAMYSSWEIRGEVEEVIDDISANQHIDSGTSASLKLWRVDLFGSIVPLDSLAA